MSRLVNRNVSMAQGRTSMRLEPELWNALDEICARERIGLRDMVGKAGEAADEGGRTSAVRVAILHYFRSAATEDGHRIAGHGAATAGIAS